ncbi:MARVEL domain-containing protein 3-like isoform X2 [Rana temporaria]|uniref:MARVEL domain-containing protein 3-like isoform X2 n=1 Tax=Rana temporaria TaxID=8407 RepID=UPI001AADD26A|nr:MARVEL domain-containing protein 3-like isoform X2 [Rana temporaria]
MSRSQRSANSNRIPPSHKSYDDRSRRERPSHNGSTNQDHPRYQLDHERRDRRSHERLTSQTPVRSQNSRAPTVVSDHHSRHGRPSPSQYNHSTPRSHVEKQTFSEKCSNLCSRRGMLQLVEILLNLLILICASTTESASAGFSSIGGFGSAYYYSMGYTMSGFVGDEVNQVAQLDVQYSRMKLPTIYAAVAISLLMLTLTLSFLSASCVSNVAHNRKLLLSEVVFNVISALIYIVCVALYIHFIEQINATELCKQRASLYHRRGFNSVTCDIMGTEMAASVFAVIIIALYVASAVVAGLLLRIKKSDGKVSDSEALKRTKEEDNSQLFSLTNENIKQEGN